MFGKRRNANVIDGARQTYRLDIFLWRYDDYNFPYSESTKFTSVVNAKQVYIFHPIEPETAPMCSATLAGSFNETPS